jgi:hypothetical protein
MRGTVRVASAYGFETDFGMGPAGGTAGPPLCGKNVQERIVMFVRTFVAATAMAALPFAAQAQQLARSFTRDTPIETIAADPAGAAVLNKDIPGLLADKSYPDFKAMSLKQVQALSGGELSESTVEQAENDLKALPAH